MGNVQVQEPPKVEIKKPYAFHGERVSDHNWNQFIHIYAVVTTILFLKYFFSTLYGVNPEHHPKEDSDVMEQSTPTDVKRRERQFMNDVESIPFHVSIFILAFVIQNFSNAAGHGRIGTLTLCYVYPVYMFSRVIYTICYIFALQVSTICENDIPIFLCDFRHFSFITAISNIVLLPGNGLCFHCSGDHVVHGL